MKKLQTKCKIPHNCETMRACWYNITNSVKHISTEAFSNFGMFSNLRSSIDKILFHLKVCFVCRVVQFANVFGNRVIRSKVAWDACVVQVTLHAANELVWYIQRGYYVTVQGLSVHVINPFDDSTIILVRIKTEGKITKYLGFLCIKVMITPLEILTIVFFYSKSIPLSFGANILLALKKVLNLSFSFFCRNFLHVRRKVVDS